MPLLDKARAIAARLLRVSSPMGGDAVAVVGVPVAPGAGELGVPDADLLSASTKLFQVSRTRKEQHERRVRMDREDAVVSKALDVTADVAFSPEEEDDSGDSFAVQCEDDPTREEALRCVETLRLQEESWSVGRQLLKFGNVFREIVLDPVGTRVVRYKPLQEDQCWRRLDQYGLPREFPWEQRLYWEADGTGRLFLEWQIAHYRHRPDDEGIYGRGILDCERDWQRLQAEEDGMVLIRLHRAGDRKIHYILVDPSQGADACAKQVEDYKRKWRAKTRLSSAYGTQQRDSPEAVTDDYFVPVPILADGRSMPQKAGIEPYTPQNAQLQNIRDVEYLRAKVLAKLSVPQRFLNIGGTEGARASLGEGGISAEDVQFARVVRTLQQDVRRGHLKPLTLHLILRGYNPVDNPVTLAFPRISTADALRQADIDLKRAQALQIVAGLLQLPPDLVVEHYMGLSPEEKERWFGETAEGVQAAAAAPTATERRRALRELAESVAVMAGAELGALHEHCEHAHGSGGAGGNGRPAHPYPAPLGRS